jgi:hypothetical protein
MGTVLIRAGMGSISVMALAAGFAVAWGGTPVGPAEAGSPVERRGISVFGTIHPAIFDLRPPVGSQIPAGPGVSMASLEMPLDAVAGEEEAQSEAPASTAHQASFDSFDERFASIFARRPGPDDDAVVFGPPVSPMPLVAALPAPTGTFALPPQPRADVVPPQGPAKNEAAAPAAGQPAPEAATVNRSRLPATSRKPVRAAEAPSDSTSLPDPDSRTAIYDIAAHAVYLPNGNKLEAHSGLGSIMDDPRSVGVKDRGPTPPNVYDLALRERMFHGVRAIRLIPAGEGNMFGRDGLLAHSYMLGPNGQSNGCVSFSDYPAFLNAFLKGEVNRLVVVEHLAGEPPGTAKAGLGWLLAPLRNLFKSS